ncbi:MAG TPA: hypothetical protein VF493_09190 [Terriglobales bacterium]
MQAGTGRGCPAISTRQSRQAPTGASRGSWQSDGTLKFAAFIESSTVEPFSTSTFLPSTETCIRLSPGNLGGLTLNWPVEVVIQTSSAPSDADSVITITCEQDHTLAMIGLVFGLHVQADVTAITAEVRLD